MNCSPTPSCSGYKKPTPAKFLRIMRMHCYTWLLWTGVVLVLVTDGTVSRNYMVSCGPFGAFGVLALPPSRFPSSEYHFMIKQASALLRSFARWAVYRCHADESSPRSGLLFFPSFLVRPCFGCCTSVSQVCLLASTLSVCEAIPSSPDCAN